MYVRVWVRRYNGKAAANGTHHIINGAAGNNEGLESGEGPGHGLTVAAKYNETGYGELSQIDAYRLRWRYILTGSGAVFDELVLTA